MYAQAATCGGGPASEEVGVACLEVGLQLTQKALVKLFDGLACKHSNIHIEGCAVVCVCVCARTSLGPLVSVRIRSRLVTSQSIPLISLVTAGPSFVCSVCENELCPHRECTARVVIRE